MTGGLLERLRLILGGTAGAERFPAAPIVVRIGDRTETPGLRWPSARPDDAAATRDGAGLAIAVNGPPITAEMVLTDANGGMRRLTSRLQPGWLRVTAWSEPPLAGEVSLIATALDAAGQVIGRVPMPLSTERRDGLLEAPEGVSKLVLALRFAEDAQIGGVRVVLETAAEGGLPALGEWADRSGDLAEHLRDRLARRDYAAVIALAETQVFRNAATGRAGLTALIELRRFEEALKFQDGLDLGDDPGAEQRILEALGNLGRWGEVRRRIRRTLKREPAEVRTPLLLRSFAFTAGDADLRRRVLARLAEEPEAIPAGERAALDVAARMAFEAGAPGDARFIETVATDDALPAVQRYLLTGQIALAGGDLATHWAAANRALALHDLEPLLPPDPLTPMAVGRLACAAPAGSAKGHLVTAIMTTFNSAATVAHSLASLADQSHGPLEIIVVDDASTDDTAQRVEAFAAARPGIALTVLRQASNGGTYVARNRALEQARGAYVFNQDSDDWAHPRKVERLLAAATAPGRVAAYGQGLRLSPDGRLTARRGFLAPDTSILFERERVLGALGGYDPVRAGADGEFQRRMERHFGLEAIAVLPEPLSIIAARAGSLSRRGRFAIDEETGVFSPERNAYRRAYLERHAAMPPPPGA